MAKRDESVTIGVTPVGSLSFPSIVVANDFHDKAKPAFRTALVLSMEDSQGLISEIKAGMEDAAALAKSEYPKKKDMRAHLPYEAATDSDGNELQAVLFRFKKGAGGVRQDGTQWSSTLAVFNKDGSEYEGPEPWGGSTARISYELRPYATPLGGGMYGVSIKMRAVQLHDVKLPMNDATDYGFDKVMDDSEDSGYGF